MIESVWAGKNEDIGTRHRFIAIKVKNTRLSVRAHAACDTGGGFPGISGKPLKHGLFSTLANDHGMHCSCALQVYHAMRVLSEQGECHIENVICVNKCFF